MTFVLSKTGMNYEFMKRGVVHGAFRITANPIALERSD